MSQTSEEQRTGLSRDFALVSGVVFFFLLLFALWVTVNSYEKHSEEMSVRMQAEATRIDHLLSLEIDRAGHLLESLARQITHIGPENGQEIAALLRSFDHDGVGVNLFAWAGEDQQIMISSQQGMLAQRIDISDRDYIKKSIIEPWKVQIGRPIRGRLSGRDVIPISLGVQDVNDKYRGAVLASIDVQGLAKEFKASMQLKELDYTVMTKGLVQVLQHADTQGRLASLYSPQELLQRLSNTLNTEPKEAKSYFEDYLHIIHFSAERPFIYMLGYDLHHQRMEFIQSLAQRLFPLVLFIIFLLLTLLVVKRRLLEPLHTICKKVRQLLAGENIRRTERISALPEVKQIDKELVRISEYINERRRIEHEQKHRLALMKKAKEAAEISNRVKLNFMNSMSHELRIPLNTISGFSELMKNEVYGPVENNHYRQYIEDIYQSASLLQSLINDVIALGKAESDMMDLHEKPVKVQAVVAKCIRVLTDRLKETHITVENRVSEQLPQLQVDELRLKQIILNLLTNSISHTPKAGSIMVDAQCVSDTEEDTRFEIIITDYGAKRLPERADNQSLSEQLDEDGKPLPRKRSEIGQTSNLGVPLTRALVAMHQGELEIHSTPGSNATKVIVRFGKERIVN